MKKTLIGSVILASLFSTSSFASSSADVKFSETVGTVCGVKVIKDSGGIAFKDTYSKTGTAVVDIISNQVKKYSTRIKVKSISSNLEDKSGARVPAKLFSGSFTPDSLSWNSVKLVSHPQGRSFSPDYVGRYYFALTVDKNSYEMKAKEHTGTAELEVSCI